MAIRMIVLLFMAWIVSPLAAAPPTDLAMVPPDAVAVVHVRGKELWKSDLLNGIRNTIEKAGAKAITAFDEGFYPRPSTLDRLTLVVYPRQEKKPIDFIVILGFDTAFDSAKIQQAYCEKVKAGENAKSFRVKNSPFDIAFPDNQHLILGSDGTVEQFLTRVPGKANSVISTAIERASAGQTTLIAAVDLSFVPPQMRRINGFPEEVNLLFAAHSAIFTLESAKGESRIFATVQYQDDTAATGAEFGLKTLMKMATSELNKMKPEMEATLFGSSENKIALPRPIGDLPAAGSALMGLGMMNQMEEWIAKSPVVRNGNQLKLDYTIPKEYTAILGYYSMGLGLMLPAVQKVREAAGRANGQNNLKQIGIALHSYHDTYGRFPSQSPTFNPTAPKDSKKRLSWRVHILPFVEEDALYRKFKLDEPWDSEHNKKLIPLMPNVYKDARHEVEPGKTMTKGIVGKEAIFHPTNGRRFQEITDGTSNTIMIVVAGEPVIWTAPEDIEFDSTKNLPDLTKPFGSRTNVALADGSVRTIDFASLKPEVIKALFGINDRIVIPFGALEPGNQRIPTPEYAIPKKEASPPMIRSKGP